MSLEIKYKVCIIDDDPLILEMYTRALEQGGYTVLTAGDGEAGLALIKKEKPDLALVDINMPKKNGVELVKDIYADKDISQTRIIILTNQDDWETIQEIGKYNTKFYIVKAMTTPLKVVSMVKEVLS
ncbi:MAG: response regulator [Candidatus Pacebacteria bacterium]|nr:response regulator [Candidatus Paceibacterota bacterium]MDR3583387.1 response regulator [Candidatus Paceibacterota bacterium]